MAEVKITGTEVLSNKKYPLKMINFELQSKDGDWKRQSREVYHRSNAASALLYNKEKGTVILVEQFRIATYINENKTDVIKNLHILIFMSGCKTILFFIKVNRKINLIIH